MSGVKIVWGGASVGTHFNTDDVQPIFDVLKEYGVDTIDTAQLYGESEKMLGEVKAGSDFILDTKWPGGFKPDTVNKDYIVESAHESIKKLGVKQVDIFYIHAPGPEEPKEEAYKAINEVYKAGLFKRFGLSNFSAGDVQKVYDLTSERGWIKPSVYQGNYNAVSRGQETELFPTLRKLGIAFYAYSPIAGGFLSKSKQQIHDSAGRFEKGNPIGQLYNLMYNKPELLETLDKWESAATELGITKTELAYRWIAYNSPLKPEHGDAVIVGSRNVEQLKETLQGLKAGPLPASATAKIDEMWDLIKHVAPVDNYNDGYKPLFLQAK